ncbi:mandelate racemase [Microtetraspora sp. AC03309]|uniref:enolase C-terminal domain-like protein n=1 Tax=Microtetraspora sp. AC03309 TaxID=2779376 RepID=UPI001E57FF3D|nr:enolase C-terminal domain-like protein [Microtetraspora sp. AC03309]MCC5580054.1 mandelate racemase [Microtetraspora sp. AC03309]
MTPIRGLTATAYTVPTDLPEADGTLAWDRTTLVLVRATGGGQTGLGWTYGSAACAAIARDDLAPVVRGRSALDVPAAFEAMARQVRNIGRAGAAGYAMSAIETALWDLKARLLGVPLCALFGQASDGVRVYGSGGFTTYPHALLAEQLGGWVHDRGIPRVKIKIGESRGTREERDLHRVRQARDAIGSYAELYVDANGAYTAKQAIRMARAMDEWDVRWFEEPVSSDDVRGMRRVRDAVRADVAAGEYGCDLYYFRRLVRVVDCLQIDVTRCGGILEWRRAAAVAAARGLEVSGHCAPQLHLHAALATPNVRHLEWFHDHVRIESMFFDGFREPVEGVLRPDLSRPGLGLDLREADVERFRTYGGVGD